MRRSVKLALIVVGVLALAWLMFSWFEAEKEISVLCSVLHPGLDRESVEETLETGDYLRYRTEAAGPDGTIVVDSLYNLGSSRCVIEFEADQVQSNVFD